MRASASLAIVIAATSGGCALVYDFDDLLGGGGGGGASTTASVSGSTSATSGSTTTTVATTSTQSASSVDASSSSGGPTCVPGGALETFSGAIQLAPTDLQVVLGHAFAFGHVAAEASARLLRVAPDFTTMHLSPQLAETYEHVAPMSIGRAFLSRATELRDCTVSGADLACAPELGSPASPIVGVRWGADETSNTLFVLQRTPTSLAIGYYPPSSNPATIFPLATIDTAVTAAEGKLSFFDAGTQGIDAGDVVGFRYGDIAGTCTLQTPGQPCVVDAPILEIVGMRDATQRTDDDGKQLYYVDATGAAFTRAGGMTSGVLGGVDVKHLAYAASRLVAEGTIGGQPYLLACDADDASSAVTCTCVTPTQPVDRLALSSDGTTAYAITGEALVRWQIDR